MRGLPHELLAVDCALDAQSVGHLVEHAVVEKRIEGDVLLLVFGDQHVGDGDQDLVELGAHGVLQLQTAGTFFKLHGPRRSAG